MVTTTPSAKGALVCEAAMSPPVWKLCVGMPVSCTIGRRCVIPVLVSVHSAWFFCMKYTVKGNIMFIPFFHSVYFFSWDSMNVSSTWKKCKYLVKAEYQNELPVLYKSCIAQVSHSLSWLYLWQNIRFCYSVISQALLLFFCCPTHPQNILRLAPEMFCFW